MKPVLYRYRDSESVIKHMDGYTPGEGWEPLYDNPQPERKHTDADLAAEYERGRKAGLTQAYDAALAQQERQSHTPETVRKIIEDDRAQRGEPVAWRAWFDKDSGARWLFSLWPDEENKGLEVDWQPLYTAPQPERKPMMDQTAHDMNLVAEKYAHKLALDLECVLADYSGTWYETAMKTLGDYRSAMNAIHERESPTFMGEPLILKDTP